MKKQFQSKSVPRGTRTIWRYLGALFLLFTFAIGNVWGAPTIPSTTLTLPATGLGEWSGFDKENSSYNDAENGYVIYSPYAIRMSKSTQTWYAVTGTTGSATGSWNSSDIFKGAAYYGIYSSGETDANKYRQDVFKKDKTDLYHYYRVTNCTGLKMYFKSSKSCSISIKVYEITGAPGSETATEVTAAANSKSYTSAAAQTLANNSTLDASKNYVIEIHGTEGNNANVPFYELAFYYPGTTPSCTHPEIAWATEPANGEVDADNFTASVTTTPAAYAVTWTSSDATVAAVTNGVIEYKKAGSAKITASLTYSGDDYCEETVKVEKTITVTTPKTYHTITPNFGTTNYEIYGLRTQILGGGTSVASGYSAWVDGAARGGSNTSYTIPSGAGSDWWETSSGKNGYGYAQFRSTHSLSFYVTNCVSVSLLQDGGGSSRSATLSVTKAGVEVDAVKYKNGSGINVLTYSGLASADKYVVTISTNDASNNTSAYQIRFEAGVPSYTITYNKGAYGEGDAIAAGIKEKDVAYTISSSTYSREGYTQTGWSLKDFGADGYAKDYEFGDSYTTNADLNLYPFWVSNTAAKHNITYNAESLKGQSVAGYPVEYTEGEGIEGFDALADIENFHFNGWSPASISPEANTDIEVSATWVDAYYVSFTLGEATEGTAPATFQKWDGAKFNLPGQGEMVAPEGKAFDGWKVNGSGDKLAANTEYTMGASAVEFVAQWKNVILLIKNDGSLNTTNFQTNVDVVDGVAASGYAKQAKVKNNISGMSNFDNLGKGVIYHTTTNSTKVTIAMYNNYTGNATSTAYYVVVPEGTTSIPTATSMVLNKGEGEEFVVNMTGRSTLYVFSNQKELRISQITVEENGTANKVAPEVGYSVNLNKPRPILMSDAATTFEGIIYEVPSNYKPVYAQIQVKTCGTDYYSFTIPAGQTRQLQLTTSNTEKYVVSKTLGDNTESKKVSGNQNINLTAGIWYINPQGSNVNITSIAFGETPDPLTVTFKDGESTLSEHALFVGDKVAEPEAPTKTGYRLDKWQRSGADYDFDYTLVAGDAPGFTLDAVWQKTWKVTFDADNGSDPVVVTVDNNQTVAQPADPEKAGFDFVEWQLSGSTYDFSAAVTTDITLVATWVVAQDDASLSALSYNGNAIDVASAEDVSGVQTYTYHLPWGSTIDPALVSVTKNAETATVGSITYDSENNRISFAVESGNHTVTINYAIQFVIDAKRGTSIVKATTNNVVTGLIGGTIDQSYSGNANSRKLNKGNYFGVTLANDETFQEGDVFFVNITTPADLGKFMIYADKDRTELIADQGIVYTKPNVASPVVCPTGEMMLVLPAAANGKKSLYLSRENVDNSEQWNVTFSYIEVTREMNPAIKSFKFGDDAATINESAKTITYEVAYGTDVTALTPTVEAYGNNGATYTPSGATDFTSPVVYTVTDAYNELHIDYTVTVNIAAPSTNAYLASLSVAGYALDFDKEVETYNIVLDYGTTVLPTITYEVEDAGLAEAVKVEDGVNGATTITVTPQAGAGYKKVYTINFSVNTTPTFKVFDGRTMNAAIVSFTDPTSGMTWTSEGAATSSSGNTKTINGKTYTKSVKIFGSATNAGRYLKFTVPADYVAKFYLAGSTNSSTGEATLFFSKELTADPAKAIAGLTASVDDPKWAQTDYQLPGDYYFCVTGSARIYELSVTLYPIDEERAMTQGRFGTICYPNGGYLVGAMLLEIAYFDPDQKKIFFDEVIGGQMVAGAPYLFLPNEGVDKFAIVYTDNVNASAGHHNGLYGSYTQEALPTDGNHYIMLNNQYCKVVEANTYVGANRAYIQLDKIGNDYVAPAYGRRRVSMNVNAEQVVTDIDNLNAGEQPVKMMIDGKLYILRGEKMFDATGRLVK